MDYWNWLFVRIFAFKKNKYKRDMEEMQEKSNTLQIEQSRIDIQTYHWNQLTLSYSFLYGFVNGILISPTKYTHWFSYPLKYLMWIRNTTTKYPNNLHLHIFSERWKPPLVNKEMDYWDICDFNDIVLFQSIQNYHIYGVNNHLSRTNRAKSIMKVFHIHPHSKSEKEECILSLF